MPPDHVHEKEWKFDDPQNTAAFACKEVSEGAPVLFVSHDDDGDWQFLCGGVHSDGGVDGAVLRCLGCVVARDPTLSELSDLGHHHEATRTRVGAAWQRRDRHEDFIVHAVEKYGWSVQLIPAGGPDEPAFAYTVGLSRTFQHAELIIFGLSSEVMHTILNGLGEMIRDGRTLRAGDSVDGVLERFPVRVRDVLDERSYRQHVGYALWFSKGKNFRLLQVVWPDKQGRFPGEASFDPSIAGLQPLLP